jgi:hypothetical protein
MMKSKKLVALQELLCKRSKQPWACFETDGFSDDGLGIAMSWNPAFIQMLHQHGIQGVNDQETVQLFFLFMSNRVAEGIGGENTVNPSGTPQLTNEANMLRV